MNRSQFFSRLILKTLIPTWISLVLCLPAFAQSANALSYCREKIRLEQEAVHSALEKHQQALDRYLAFVKKQEDNGWAGSSSLRKQQILDDIVFFRQPIENLKKTEFTHEEDCLEKTNENLWATRLYVLNLALDNRGYLSRQQVESDWQNPKLARLRQLLEQAEEQAMELCIFVTYDQPDTVGRCVTGLLVVFDTPSEGTALMKQISRETHAVLKDEIVSERDAPDCQLSVSCYFDN
ncbi:hypothetical protein GFK91_29675 (plasmid) [Roseibium aggregatum]|uniref:hypothetical protein n=1 Tax=Roseibium aggregatum TaxID=187304 RepID=UPI001E5DA5A7|nr:hypothetical protein [Roseibium aggregatum]UES59920.1 hypothetical protein GFK91_29675 [Roseibium aggregatum]